MCAAAAALFQIRALHLCISFIIKLVKYSGCCSRAESLHFIEQPPIY